VLDLPAAGKVATFIGFLGFEFTGCRIINSRASYIPYGNVGGADVYTPGVNIDLNLIYPGAVPRLDVLYPQSVDSRAMLLNKIRQL
jgi:hypothetical protein